MALRGVVVATVVVTLFLLMYSVTEHSATGLNGQIARRDREIAELKRKLEDSQSCEKMLMTALEDAVHYKELAENCVHEKIKVRMK